MKFELLFQPCFNLNMNELSHDSEYNMANIFRVSHILPTYFTRINEMKWNQNMRKEENIGHIVREKRAITSLLLKHKKNLFSVNSACIKG